MSSTATEIRFIAEIVEIPNAAPNGSALNAANAGVPGPPIGTSQSRAPALPHTSTPTRRWRR